MNPTLSETNALREKCSYPGSLEAPLARFIFDTDQWVMPAALMSDIGITQHEPWSSLVVGNVIRTTVARHFPPNRLDLALLTSGLAGRLALLPRAEWLRLGLTLSFLPYCGHIRNSMDGHFRRVIRENLDESSLLTLEQHGEVEERPQFKAGPGAWRHPQIVALGGVRAGLEQVCRWPGVVRQRFELQFDSNERSVEQSVHGLNGYWMELACKIIFPQHHWLWS
ncbi:MAG: hypothetical protein VW831_00355 [Gammaproteobacteria bacterium]